MTQAWPPTVYQHRTEEWLKQETLREIWWMEARRISPWGSQFFSFKPLGENFTNGKKWPMRETETRTLMKGSCLGITEAHDSPPFPPPPAALKGSSYIGQQTSTSFVSHQGEYRNPKEKENHAELYRSLCKNFLSIAPLGILSAVLHTFSRMVGHNFLILWVQIQI